MPLTKQTVTDKIEISGYEGRYSVTADGKIWSHPREIAKMFKTSQAVIQYIVSGKTYSEVA